MLYAPRNFYIYKWLVILRNIEKLIKTSKHVFLSGSMLWTCVYSSSLQGKNLKFSDYSSAWMHLWDKFAGCASCSK